MDVMTHLLDLAEMPRVDIPDSALQAARNSLFDWLVCGRAGQDEPLARILRDMAAQDGGHPQAAVFGGRDAPARMAALVNGAISHALDYDDTHFAHIGHLSVGIYPAALAVGQAQGLSVDTVAEAFLIGAEVAIRVGLVLGAGHYNRGFHMTSTAGAFGATVAAGRLYGLSRDQMRHAVGLCATRASGLKGQFGTMGKPYNAGLSASTGVESAWLAGQGMTSAPDGLMGAQGFVATHADAPAPKAFWQSPPPDTFLFQDIKYKFHACCHGTHAMIEALQGLRAQTGLTAAEVAGVQLHTNPRWLVVCDKKAPQTGLEVKFSYAWLAGMVLGGVPTGDDKTYTDALAGDADLRAFATRVTVTGDETVTDMQARGHVTTRSGQRLDFAHDLSAPLTQQAIHDGLTHKARAIIGDAADPLWNRLAQGGLQAAELGGFVRGQG
ncbi:MmgE/PrpD family protein [Tropicibacter oceani]|uniref:MmgE/PrpD family protein n=1 Tax=Tropicibacter oceani TaxID=3058420 RepID=A0ABY8QCJ4_9RHOB|nr:MmgE/PrpD family protein [Tropicibacter oceani]WGW02347.1 MmgE/PrpD family protein [Tropicibacter oceani]